MKISSKRLNLDYNVEGREENDILHLSDSGKYITMDRMLEKMKTHERNFPISKYSQHLIHGDANSGDKKEFILHYECKTYWITDTKGEMLTPKLPAASKEMFYYVLHVRDQVPFLEKDHVMTYIGVKFGKRAYRLFWTNITREELMDLFQFEVRYIHDVRCLEDARALTNSSLSNVNIPTRLLKENGIRYYHMASLARGASIILEKPWLMNNLPRNYTEVLTDAMHIDAIDWVLNKFNIEIDQLRIKHIKSEKMHFVTSNFNYRLNNVKEAYKTFKGGNHNIEKYKEEKHVTNVDRGTVTEVSHAQH